MWLTRLREKSMPPGPLGCLEQLVHRGWLKSVLYFVTMDSADNASALPILSSAVCICDKAVVLGNSVAIVLGSSKGLTRML